MLDVNIKMTNTAHKQLIGVVCNIENNYLQQGYLAIIKDKHPGAEVIVISYSQLHQMDEWLTCAYIITDYIHYASKCVCQDAEKKSFILLMIAQVIVCV